MTGELCAKGQSRAERIEGDSETKAEERVRGIVMHVWQVPLSLSVAEEIAARWSEGNDGRELEERAAVRELTKTVQATGWSLLRVTTVGGKENAVWTERVVLNDKRIAGGVSEEQGRRVSGGEVQRIREGMQGGTEWGGKDFGEVRGEKSGSFWGEGKGTGRMLNDELARVVADRLYGRAALLNEVQELLAAGPPACQAVAAGGWSALALALQWAALRGLVRLRCAVAPQQPAASPLSRLLPAPMRRGRPWRRRCLRCGSGEARMNRTACAACGSSACAYCEACLTMGRSRECGLLVLGGGEVGLADAQGAAMPEAAPGLAAARAHRMHALAAFAARWGLSPAQQAAALAALEYALPRLASSVRQPSSQSSLTRSEQYSPYQTSLAPSSNQQASSLSVSDRSHYPLSQPQPIRSTHHSESLSSPAIPDTQPMTLSPTLTSAAVESSTPSSAPIASQFLIWAVTGAGKTEMVFPLIDAALSSGGRALIATPRRDVVLELDPRLRRAFPDIAVVTLYGGSEQRWEDGQITIATTHQLFRFQERFDLVIIDELDAFPYHGDPQLHYAAAKAGVPGGAVILLSATPPRAMQQSVRRGRIGCARVPVRFHRHPLPVPQQIRMPRVSELLAKSNLPRQFISRLSSSLARGAQCFVFVGQIRHAEPLAQLLRAALPGIPVGATSSKDADRPQHVQAFRNREFRVLVTTTILERGVTVPFSDVFILDADGKLFDEASLVQMAGRAGRSKDDPNGRVYFLASASNQSQRRAIAQIKSMNREAKRSGYLLPREGQ